LFTDDGDRPGWRSRSCHLASDGVVVILVVCISTPIQVLISALMV